MNSYFYFKTQRNLSLCRGEELSSCSVWRTLLTQFKAGVRQLLPLLMMFGVLLGPTGAWAATAMLTVCYSENEATLTGTAGCPTNSTAPIEGAVTVGTAVNFTPVAATPLNTPITLFFKILGDTAIPIDVDLGPNVTTPTGFSFTDNATPIFPSFLAQSTESGTFQLTLDATSSGPFAGTVDFTYDDNPAGTTGAVVYQITVAGTVDTSTATAGGEIMLEDITDADPGVEMVDGTDPEVDFASATEPTAQGTPVTRTFRITNVDGIEDLELTGIAFTNNEYTITTPLPAQLLDPGVSVTFDVQFKATNSGTIDPATGEITPITGEMIIGNSDSDEGPFNTILNGYVEAVIPSVTAPEIDVADEGTDIADSAGSTFSETPEGTPILAGTSLTKTFTITNNGDADLDLKSLTIGGINAPVFSWAPVDGTLPDVLSPTATTDFTVTFSPTDTGNYKGLVQIFSNDEDENPFDIPLEAIAASAEKEIDLSEATLGSFETGTTVDYTATTPTVVGTPITKTFTITNLGGTTLEIDSITFSSGGEGFTLLATPKNLDPAGGASDSLEFDVTLDAADPGTFEGVIAIENNDDTDNEAPFTFTVTADVAASLTNPEVMVWEVLEDGTSKEITDDQEERIDFSASIGESSTKEFKIKNLGGVPLSLEGFSPLPKGFTLVGEFPINVLANETVGFTLKLDTATEGNYGGDFTFFNDDPDENPFTFPIGASVLAPAPEIEVLDGSTEVADGTQVAVEFGPTGVGSSVSKTFTVKNSGDADLNLTNMVTFSEGGDGFTINSFNPGLVSAGGSRSFTVTLNATEAGNDYKGTISFENNDSDESPYTFPVSGVVEATTPANQEITLWDGNQDEVAAGTAVAIEDGTSTVIEFGNTEIGTPLTQTFTVQNLGLSDLHLYGLQRPGCYTLVGGALPPVVPASGQISFDVQLAATENGVCEGRFELFNDDADETPYDFPVHGIVGEVNGNTFTLTVSSSGEGVVTSEDSSINCGTDATACTADYAADTSVMLTATADANHQFKEWTGDCTTTVNPATVVMDAQKSCSAIFTPITATDETLNFTQPSNGKITTDVGGIDCGHESSTCQASYDSGTRVTVTATAQEHFIFESWGGDCSPQGVTNPMTLIMSESFNCSVNFKSTNSQATLSFTKPDNGTITTTDGKVDCGNTCSASYAVGETIAITASSLSAQFAGWEGDCTGTNNPLSVTVTQEIADQGWSCHATFTNEPTAEEDCFEVGLGLLVSGDECIQADELVTDEFSATLMRGGISKFGRSFEQRDTVTLIDPIRTAAVIKVDAADIGKPADIVVIGLHKSEALYPDDGFAWYMMIGDDSELGWTIGILPYNDDSSPQLEESVLPSLMTISALSAYETIYMYSGNFVYPGPLEILFGYRIRGEKVVLNLEPIQISILPPPQ